jgi:hypothetical protein
LERAFDGFKRWEPQFKILISFLGILPLVVSDKEQLFMVFFSRFVVLLVLKEYYFQVRVIKRIDFYILWDICADFSFCKSEIRIKYVI